MSEIRARWCKKHEAVNCVYCLKVKSQIPLIEQGTERASALRVVKEHICGECQDTKHGDETHEDCQALRSVAEELEKEGL